MRKAHDRGYPLRVRRRAPPRTVAAALSAAVTSTNSQESTPTSQAEPPTQKHTTQTPAALREGARGRGFSTEAASLADTPVRFHSSGRRSGGGASLREAASPGVPPPASLREGSAREGLFYRKVLSLAVLFPFPSLFVILDGRGMGMRSKRERFLKAAERLNAVRCRCCGGRMTWRGDCFACEAGHTQDVNRKGYVNCLTRPAPDLLRSGAVRRTETGLRRRLLCRGLRGHRGPAAAGNTSSAGRGLRRRVLPEHAAERSPRTGRAPVWTSAARPSSGPPIGPARRCGAWPIWAVLPLA